MRETNKYTYMQDNASDEDIFYDIDSSIDTIHANFHQNNTRKPRAPYSIICLVQYLVPTVSR